MEALDGVMLVESGRKLDEVSDGITELEEQSGPQTVTVTGILTVVLFVLVFVTVGLVMVLYVTTVVTMGLVGHGARLSRLWS